MNINEFEIVNLYGRNTFKLLFEDNTVILVGENGAGKTTILRLLFYFISGQWEALRHYEFDSICIVINKKKFELKHKEINPLHMESVENMLRYMPSRYRKDFYKVIEQTQGDYYHPLVRKYIDSLDIPFEALLIENRIYNKDDKKREQFERKISEIKKIMLSHQILYLPTYRRIEQEFEFIFKETDESPKNYSRYRSRERVDKNTYIELIEFGMKDVAYAIDNTLRELKEFAREELNKLTLGYLGDVVEQQYNKIDLNQIKRTSGKMIENVLNRIEENILSQENKMHISAIIKEIKNKKEISEHSKVICHYFLKLLKFQEELEKKEAKIQQFCRVCNEYLAPEKYLNYDSSTFEFYIRKKDDYFEMNNKVQLKNLSSGEKQVVSLFSHLYLSGNKRFFVLIDEPELSLSVPWQQRFLSDIKNSNLCSGLVAVTHSPFIYENELKKFARSLGEFMQGK